MGHEQVVQKNTNEMNTKKLAKHKAVMNCHETVHVGLYGQIQKVIHTIKLTS